MHRVSPSSSLPPALPLYVLAVVSLGGFGLAFDDPDPPAEGKVEVEAAPQARFEAPAMRFVENDLEGGCQLAVETVGEHGAQSAELSLHQVGPKGTLEVSRAVTDGRGLHRFSDLAPGTYHLSARAGGHALGAAPVWTCDGDESRAFFRVALAPGGSLLEGRITGFGGTPAPGTEVFLEQPGRHQDALMGVAHVPVAADGSFQARLAPGEYRLLALAPHHTPQVQQLRISGAQAARTRITLDWKPEASGQVLGPDNQPVADAEVFLGPMFDPRLGATSVRTDHEGRFTIAILPDRPLTLTARRGAYLDTVALEAATAVEGHRDVTLVLQKGREVKGYVQKTSGLSHAFGDVAYRVRSLGLVGTVKADEEGFFRIPGMPRDDVELWPAGSAIGAWGGAVAEVSSPMVLLTFVPEAYAQR